MEGDASNNSNDTSDIPFEWIISRVCEEFNCLPSQAYREIMNDPSQMVFDIMELRSYARAKEILDNAKKEEDIPNSPAIDQVWMVQEELARRQKEVSS